MKKSTDQKPAKDSGDAGANPKATRVKINPVRYFFLHPYLKWFWNFWLFLLFGDKDRGKLVVGSAPSEETTAEEVQAARMTYEKRWKISSIAVDLIGLMEFPLTKLGQATEYLLNFYSLNAGFFGMFYNIVTTGKPIFPESESVSFLSLMGFLDGRLSTYGSLDLYWDQTNEGSEEKDPLNLESHRNSKAYRDWKHVDIMDLCIMASKLAYENARVAEIVVKHWKMHFVNYYDCVVRDHKNQKDTHVFMFCDKPKDANLIIMSFRGTAPFSTRNWSTDFDFSLVEFGEAGLIHVGFLHAMGGYATSLKTIEFAEDGAYVKVLSTLKKLLDENKNARFIVTGHSLGGALAIMFPCILQLNKENDVLDRLEYVYTFGQPRVGNYNLGYLMESRLSYPKRRYFRVVYSNDIVPRMPFDDAFFTFEHFGTCIYIGNNFFGYFTREEPSKNFVGFGSFIRMRMMAMWDLLGSLLRHRIHGDEYKETWVSTVFRITGLFLPGVADHSPVNYVNGVRLGKELHVPLISLT